MGNREADNLLLKDHLLLSRHIWKNIQFNEFIILNFTCRRRQDLIFKPFFGITRVMQIKQTDVCHKGKLPPVNREAEGIFCISSSSSLIENKGQRKGLLASYSVVQKNRNGTVRKWKGKG